MDTINYSAARAKLAETMDKVNRDNAPVIITRQRGESAVLMSLADYRSIEETMYLLGTPANAAAMRRGLRAFKAGKFKPHKLIRS